MVPFLSIRRQRRDPDSSPRLSAADLLNLQVVTAITPNVVFLYLSTASSVMGYPSNSSFRKNPKCSLSPWLPSWDPEHLQRGLQVPDFQAKSALPFILHLRCVCETILDVMLRAYISVLEAYHKRSKKNREKQGSKKPSFDRRDQALKSAEDALAIFRKAEGLREGGDVYSANASVEEPRHVLKKRSSSNYVEI